MKWLRRLWRKLSGREHRTPNGTRGCVMPTSSNCPPGVSGLASVHGVHPSTSICQVFACSAIALFIISPGHTCSTGMSVFSLFSPHAKYVDGRWAAMPASSQ